VLRHAVQDVQKELRPADVPAMDVQHAPESYAPTTGEVHALSGFSSPTVERAGAITGSAIAAEATDSQIPKENVPPGISISLEDGSQPHL
jgi:hypothetical protein